MVYIGEVRYKTTIYKTKWCTHTVTGADFQIKGPGGQGGFKTEIEYVIRRNFRADLFSSTLDFDYFRAD